VKRAALLTLLVLLIPGCSDSKTDAGSGSSSAGAGTVGNTSADDNITKAAQEKIDADAALKAAGIKAVAKGGQVDLTGTVKALPDKDRAEALVRDAIKPYSNVNAGVTNNITIADPGDASSGASSGGAGH
jgi:PBP1b-binding outer membrane lipoprotein LpoB